jgi:hypothetical protein
MNDNREKILQHIDKIEHFAKQPGNEWLIGELGKRFGDVKINEIYEHCIEKIIKVQAENFYKVFPIQELIPQLTEDYCRMERFRRTDNFEDFCLSLFQQVENITNWFCQRPEFIDLYESSRDKYCCFKDIDGNYITIRELIVYSEKKEKEKYEKRKDLPLMELYFNERIRAVLYFVYFNEHPYNKYTFDSKYWEIDSLYQCRNLNHRGGIRNTHQESVISIVIPNKYQYYLKYTGLLVDFVEQIIKQMSTIEESGTVFSKLECGYVYIKPDNRDSFPINKGKLLLKVKNYNEGDRVCIITNKFSSEIVDIKKVTAK